MRGVTQAGWVAQLGFSRASVQRWEQGEAVPDAAAEAALPTLCRERGLFTRYDSGLLAGATVTEGWLAGLLAQARMSG